MRIQVFDPNQQNDPATAIGAQSALPNIIDIEELHRSPPQAPPLVIDGVLPRGFTGVKNLST